MRATSGRGACSSPDAEAELAIVFWLAAAALAFTYAGYPLLMALRARLAPRPPAPVPATPSVDVVLVVHDAADLLHAKLHNLMALDYPRARVRINVACDGCSDGSEAVARAFAGPRLRVFAHRIRRGKSACIADLLPHLDAELVLFTDVRQRVDPAAARILAAVLSDRSVGAASGELVLEAGTGYGRGIDAYWRFEKWLRRVESATGSIVGVTGALYAARRSLLVPPPPGIILDDMWIPLSIAATGHRVVFVPGAMAYDHGARDSAGEETRKRRTLAGNYQLLHRWPRLALPWGHPLALRLWGHKWLRLAAPWCLVALFASTLWLARAGGILYPPVLLLQCVAYLLAFAARIWPRLAAFPPARLCTAFLSLNLSAALALVDYLRNPGAHLWRTTRLEESRQ